MACSPASSWTIRAAAAAGYVAFWAGLIAVAAPPTAREREVRTLPSHRSEFAAAWGSARLVYDEVERRMGRLRPAQRTGIARAILEEAGRGAMDPLLVLAVIEVESRFDAYAVSGAGAVGLMQLMHPTMREEVERSRLASADPLDPVANVRAGIRYLGRLVTAFDDDLELALMAYNAGPGRIRRHLRKGEVPGRLLSYPRTVARERQRLSGTAADLRLCTAHKAIEERLAGARRPIPAPALSRPEVETVAREEQPILVALAGVRRERSRGAGNSARRPRARS